jgi:hypothetical protein
MSEDRERNELGEERRMDEREGEEKKKRGGTKDLFETAVGLRALRLLLLVRYGGRLAP